ncbi:ATP-binding protein [Nanoarchaeota archaeon]
MIKGQVISGEFGKILIRKKSDALIELGELLIAESKTHLTLLQVYDLIYGSQISKQNLELISGMKLEENADFDIMDAELRNYMIAAANNILAINKTNERSARSKHLPDFFSEVREIKEQDLKFLTTPKNPLSIGKIRSGSKELDIEIFLNGRDVFSHHILIPATTGRGKSNLTSCMLWDVADKDYCGILVLDPHDEYYGRTSTGLKDHPRKDNISYYSKDPLPGTKSLKINLTILRPHHFDGVSSWSRPQKEAMVAYYRKFSKSWIEKIFMDDISMDGINEATVGVIRRKFQNILNLTIFENQLQCQGIFDFNAGENTIPDICNELEKSKIVIVDTSSFPSAVEILVGSLITNEIFRRYRYYKTKGELDQKPVISIILEEAPRVLGKEVLEKGSNIFSTIAREGRKFKIGLTAITQLPSLIPREILANMNTKIILGIEMAPERQAIIDSASQDLSNDSRTIASLDKGEAIITSNFVGFAIPVKIPFFQNIVKETLDKQSNPEIKTEFKGIG